MPTIGEIAAAMNAAATVITATSQLFSFVGQLMETAENAYAGIANSGGTKKAAVLAALAALAKTIGENFAAIQTQISSWIDVVKSAYNAAIGATAPKVVAGP